MYRVGVSQVLSNQRKKVVILLSNMKASLVSGGENRDINSAGERNCFQNWFKPDTDIFRKYNDVCHSNSCNECARWTAENLVIITKQGNLNSFKED